VTSLPMLTKGFVTFGSFNNISKITPDVVALWSKVLFAVPHSRLIIKWASLSKKKVRERLLRQFARCGISFDRLELRSKSSHHEMLAEYGDLDIALDPFPYSGGLTSCEALWMGVPVLTLLSDKPAGRQTAGFLRTIGIPELITQTPDEFVRQAVKFTESARVHEGITVMRWATVYEKPGAGSAEHMVCFLRKYVMPSIITSLEWFKL
jgi:protein O-GlcNAc transferase